MESVCNGNGKDKEKLIRSKLGEMEWNIYEEISR